MFSTMFLFVAAFVPIQGQAATWTPAGALTDLFDKASSAPAAILKKFPIELEFCMPMDGLSSWTYVQSHEITNGEVDHQAYLELELKPSPRTGLQSIVTQVAIPGLEWDRGFKQVSFKANSVTTICGVDKWYGVKKYTNRCYLEGLKVENNPNPKNDCWDPSRMLGYFVVQD